MAYHSRPPAVKPGARGMAAGAMKKLKIPFASRRRCGYKTDLAADGV